MHKGSCLCGSISFEVNGDLTSPNACHCTQCRKQSGHVWASSNVTEDSLTISGRDSLTWFTSSTGIERGFCNQCGSVLFWNRLEQNYISVAMGAFEKPTDIKLKGHIFTADKGDYYEIEDGLPQS